MGEGKARRRAHERLLADHPVCIYCAGTNPASTIEHMPPIIMFNQRQRPKGLEFPTCKECNNGTRLTDLVASLLGRVYPDSERSAEEGNKKAAFSGQQQCARSTRRDDGRRSGPNTGTARHSQHAARLSSLTRQRTNSDQPHEHVWSEARIGTAFRGPWLIRSARWRSSVSVFHQCERCERRASYAVDRSSSAGTDASSGKKRSQRSILLLVPANRGTSS